MTLPLDDHGLSLLTRRGFMVQAMEIIDDWAEETEVQILNREMYELAERLWELWQSVVAMQKTLGRMNDGIKPG